MEQWNLLKEKLTRACPGMALLEREPMSRHTSFRVGGPVPLIALPRTEEEVQQILSAAAVECGVAPFFMGKGTNLLVADEGADLFVVKAFDGLNRLELGDWDAVRPGQRTILAGSGVSLARLANFALEHGLTGLEFAHGIPGTVGGGVYMNAGAYGGEMGQVVSSVVSAARPPEEWVEKNPQFSYRHSVYQERQDFILRAYFTLEPGDPAQIKGRMEELAGQRRSKQPLEYPSAGSTFKRPEGHFAAALIDQCGLKGLTVGGAQVSEKHAGFLINRGGATCADILTLMDRVRETVFRETGVELEPEVKLLGGG